MALGIPSLKPQTQEEGLADNIFTMAYTLESEVSIELVVPQLT